MDIHGLKDAICAGMYDDDLRDLWQAVADRDKALWQARYDFQDLNFLDDRSLQQIIKEVEIRTLVIALRGDEVKTIRQRFLDNMSQRAATMFMEDMEYMGPQFHKNVQATRQKILEIAYDLEAKGKIIFHRNNPGQELV